MAQAAKRYITGKLYDLDISVLFHDTEQTRKYFDPQALMELKSSIETHGVLQPVLVRKADDGRLLLVSGERRYQASLAAGRTTIPALLTHGDPVEIAIVENLLREGLTAIEEAEAIDRLKNAHDYQLSDLSGVLGKSMSTISEILSLVNLPDAVKDDCRNDPKAARGILVEIAKQRSAAKMHALYEKFKSRGITRGELRGKTPKLKGEAVQAAVEVAAAAPIDLAFVQKFARLLDKLEIEKLDQVQSQEFAVNLDGVRLAVIRKLRALKAQAQIA